MSSRFGRLGERLVPAPFERRQLPRHDRGVVDHEHAAELDAHVRPERRVEVAEQVALGHHPREPDRLGPPRVVGLGRVELVVGRDQAPVVGACVGHGVASLVMHLAHRCEVAVGERAHRRAHDRRLARRLTEAVGKHRIGGQRFVLDRGAHRQAAGCRRRRPPTEQTAELAHLERRELGPEAVGLPEVLDQPRDTFGARLREVVGERRQHDVAQIVERDVVHPRVRGVVGLVDGFRGQWRFELDACCFGEHLSEQPCVQRVVHQLPRDLTALVARAQTREGADRRAGLREHAEVLKPIVVDREAARPLVVAEAGVEVGEPFEGVAHQQPREVVVEITPVGELPVGHRGEAAAAEHEVARAGVALHEHDRPVAVGRHVRAQPGTRERDDRHRASGGVVLPFPLVDLGEHVRGERARRSEVERPTREGRARRDRVDAGLPAGRRTASRSPAVPPDPRSARSDSRRPRAASGTRAGRDARQRARRPASASARARGTPRLRAGGCRASPTADRNRDRYATTVRRSCRRPGGHRRRSPRATPRRCGARSSAPPRR